MKKFQAHEKSKCHSEALSVEVVRDTNRNVSEMISAKLSDASTNS